MEVKRNGGGVRVDDKVISEDKEMGEVDKDVGVGYDGGMDSR